MAYYGCSGLTADADNVLVYPTNTHVRIVGNKRTQASLTGQEGIVIKTVGLGGWHWLELKNGTTVKVQRNALCLADDVASDSCCEGASTPSERSSTHGCSEFHAMKARTAGGVNLQKLSTVTLMRYAHLHGLNIGSRVRRDALIKHVLWHFESLSSDESAILTSLCQRGR